MKKLFFILILNFVFLEIEANPQNLKLANYYTFSLQFEKAQNQIQICKKNKKTNIQANYYENYIDFLNVLLTHDEQEFEKYIKKSHQKFSTIENLQKKSPHYLYSLAQIKFNNSISNFLFGNNFTAGWELYRSYKLFKENIEKYPNFIENKKFQAIYDIVFSSIPNDYKWVISTFGINANFERGLKGLESYSAYYKKDSLVNVESSLLYSLVLMQFSEDKEKAYNYLKKSGKIEKNSLVKYVYCLVAATNGKNEEVISCIENIKEQENERQIVFFDFLLAKAKLNKLDFSAEEQFRSFLKKYKGQNYLKTVYQRIAWVYLLQGNMEKYFLNIEKTKNKGQQILEEDKQAFSEVSKKKTPNPKLLAARLFFDGAYYKKSLKELEKCNYTKFKIAEKLEYKYRFARIYHKQNQLDKAIKFYKETIVIGSELKYYFAPYSALNIAQIYKKKGLNKKAIFYFKKALQINNGQYKSSIELKAKAGLASCQA